MQSFSGTTYGLDAEVVEIARAMRKTLQELLIPAQKTLYHNCPQLATLSNSRALSLNCIQNGRPQMEPPTRREMQLQN
jgi:hypothetical protein